MSKNYKPIIIVAGEPNGIFLEIFFKTFKNKIKSPIVLIANKKLLKYQMKILKFKFKLNILDQYQIINFEKLNNNQINLINVPLSYKSIKKINLDSSNNYLKKSFHIAIQILKKNKSYKLLNGPIIKKKFLNTKHLGITEYLGYKTRTLNKVVMLIYNKNCSVSPITTHIPLKMVNKSITKKKIIQNVITISNFFKKKFNKKPKFVITGLNQHCESNYSSSEEEKIIIPAIKYLIKKNYSVKGPLAADTVFLKNNMNKFDIVIGMYHDQVLTPLKTLYNFDAINITL